MNPFPHTTAATWSLWNHLRKKMGNLSSEFFLCTIPNKIKFRWNHCSKMRNCSSWAISTFATMFSLCYNTSSCWKGSSIFFIWKIDIMQTYQYASYSPRPENDSHSFCIELILFDLWPEQDDESGQNMGFHNDTWYYTDLPTVIIFSYVEAFWCLCSRLLKSLLQNKLMSLPNDLSTHGSNQGHPVTNTLC